MNTIFDETLEAVGESLHSVAEQRDWKHLERCKIDFGLIKEN